MCGPSSSEGELETSQAGFSSTLQQAFSTQFGNQSEVLANLNASLGPTLLAGPSQQGFSPQQLAAENTTAINSTAGNFSNAQREANDKAATTANSSGLVSGPQAAINAQIASAGAQALSGEQLGITNANYAEGSKNYWNAVGGSQGLASLENPTPYATSGNNANSTAFSEANAINQQQNQEDADIGGAIFGAGMDILSGGLSSGASMGISATTGGLASTPFAGDLTTEDSPVTTQLVAPQ